MVFHFLHHFLSSWKYRIKWYIEAVIERRKLFQDTSIEDANGLEGKVIILVPHTDDEWIGCSRILSSGSHNREIILFHMDMSGGDSTEIHFQRSEEIKKIADMNCTRLIFFKDMRHFADVIRFEKPDVIMLPFFVDWHDEHIEVMNRLKAVLQNNIELMEIKIGMYQVTLPILPECITDCYKMTYKEWKFKWKVFKEIYRTQSNFPYYRVAMNERINGKLMGSFAGEVYSFADANDWINKFEYMIPSSASRKVFIPKLNDILDERQELKKFLKNIQNNTIKCTW